MPKYEVIRPWHGVEVGKVFNAERISPALAGHVRELKSAAAAEEAGAAAVLVPATPGAAAGKKPAKGDVAKRLKELGIDFDGRKSAEELLALLPDDDSLKADPNQAA